APIRTMRLHELKTRRNPIDGLVQVLRIGTQRRRPQAEYDFRLDARLTQAMQIDVCITTCIGVTDGSVPHAAPDWCGNAVARPHVNVGEADLVASRLFAALLAQAVYLSRNAIGLAKVACGVGIGNRRPERAAVHVIKQLLRSQ